MSAEPTHHPEQRPSSDEPMIIWTLQTFAPERRADADGLFRTTHRIVSTETIYGELS